MHIFAKENQNEIVNKLINHKKMQNTDTERLVAIHKAYADYCKIIDDIDTIEKARELYKRTLGGLIPGYYDMLESIFKQLRTLESTIINKVKEYFEEYSTLENLEKYLDGLTGPSAHVYALESLTGETFM